MNDPSDVLWTAIAHHQAGRLREAAELYRQVLASHPKNPEATHLLGVVAHQSGRHEEAIRLIREAIAIDGTQAAYYSNLGEACRAAGKFDEARAAILEAVRLDPRQAASYYNLALLEIAQGQPLAAADRCRQALALQANYAEAHNLLGTIHHNDGRLDEALACYEQAIACQSQFPNPHYHRGLILLTRGQWATGWDEFEWRLKMPNFPAHALNLPRWTGAPLVDQTLLVHSEQGLGDTIQLARYLPLVRERCPQVVVWVQPPLEALLVQSGFSDIYSETTALPRIDCQIPMMSLPRAFRTLPEAVPPVTAYLSAKPDLITAWSRRLADVSGFRVGICWQGSSTHVSDRSRSIPLTAFEPLASIPGVRLISLQKREGEEQLRELKSRFNIYELGDDWDEAEGPFMDTAAVIEHLDLVITADTAIAHLAGALGAPVWLALGVQADWRWMLDRSDTPWYPSMRLFRQARRDDWSELFGRVSDALRAVVNRSKV